MGLNTLTVASNYPVAYKGTVVGSKKNKWKLLVKEKLDSTERNNTWTKTLLLPCKQPLV